jgi:hypothetical protein
VSHLYSQKEYIGVSKFSVYPEGQQLTNTKLEMQLYLKQTNYTTLVTDT